MKIYHGTSSSCLRAILKKGILPGRDSSRNNWENAFAYERSNDLVYVTNAPIQYAVNASHDTGIGIVFELEINDSLVYPDPRYFIESHCDLMHQNPKAWKILTSEKSLKDMAIKNKGRQTKDMANSCCLKPIPPSAITKYLIIDFKKRKSMVDILFQEMSSRKVGLNIIEEFMGNKDWRLRMPYLSDAGLEIVNVK